MRSGSLHQSRRGWLIPKFEVYDLQVARRFPDVNLKPGPNSRMGCISTPCSCRNGPTSTSQPWNLVPEDPKESKTKKISAGYVPSHLKDCQPLLLPVLVF